MEKIKITTFKTPIGEILIGSFNSKLVMVDWKWRKMRSTIDKRIQKFLQAEFEEGKNEVISKTIEQLDEYFIGNRKGFDLPIMLCGKEFQQKVWSALLAIPYGQTSTYLKLAEKIGDSKAVRAVANANGANAISIIIPCHRIIGSDGELVGYAGGLPAKKKLLELETKFL
ncbi:MAG: cysteine methyltransferase [Ignavibacteria bacterium GWF2_33_9]|nr:MAG: cysteine methyltransferase [Ignavibacteria bacterium GWF2_33_9]